MPSIWTDFERIEVYLMLRLWNSKVPFLDQIVICDEKCILCEKRKRSAQWLDTEAHKRFPKSKLHQQNIMVTIWLSAIGVMNYSFPKSNQRITTDVYYSKWM